MRCDSSNMLLQAAKSMPRDSCYRGAVEHLGECIREVQDGELCRDAFLKFFMIYKDPYAKKLDYRQLGLCPEAQDDLVRRLG